MYSQPSSNLTDFLAGGGEMAKLVRATDWSQTPLGPIETWPQSLRTAASLCLASTFPISIAWGPGHVLIYNDGYWPICGGKHPGSMGQNFRECWSSAWPVIGDAYDRGLAGEASFLENKRLFVDRSGFLEEAFFTFSFSPIRDESGGVGGLFHPVTEQTAKMLSERRTRALRDLAAKTGKAKTVVDVLRFAAEALAEYDLDVPFALFYRIEADGAAATLAASTGLAPGGPASPAQADLGPTSPGWPFAEALNAGAGIEVPGLADKFGPLSCGPYPQPPHTAFVLPIAQPGSAASVAILVAGASARLPMDAMYRGFYDMIAATVTAAVANARAYEEETRRAEALAELDRAKTTFFSNVSHEFRTPLTLMLGPLEDVLGEAGSDLPALQRERVQVAHRNALRLLKLVNTLLDFSRIEAGRGQAAFQPTDLAALTAELASNFRSACERAGLTLTIDCPPLPSPVHVDHDMWEKIVLNLLSNAFKFTFTGEIAVTLRTVGADAVELAVRDTGIGIAEAELPRLFERFHRVEGAQGRTHEGTGIGLALVQDLVKLHGGRIRVESTVGQGTVFRVTIPLGAHQSPPQSLRPASSLSPTSIGAGPFVEEALRWLPDTAADIGHDAEAAAAAIAFPGADRPRAILADDNADMRAYVARILEAGGYEVEAVADGNAALLAARSGAPPDVVLSDVMMPRLDGFGLLRALRDDPAMEGILVILLSARAGEEARLSGLAAGADDYLVKPFSARELRARVDSAVRLSRARRAAAARERVLLAALVAEQGKAALAVSQTRLALALESGNLGSWELDVANDISVRSPQHDRIFGYARPVAEWGQRIFLEHVVPEDRDHVSGAVRRAIQTGETFQVECRIRRVDNGKISWVDIHGAPQIGADGGVATVIGVVQDITERHAIEAEKEEQRKQLLRSNADLLAFAYSASHDLKAPLRAITHLAGWISQDLATTASPETLEHLELLQGRARRLQALLDGLLAYSRIGRGESDAEDLNLADIVEDILAVAPPPPGFVVVCEGTMPTIRVMRTPLRVVLDNLIANSLKHHDRAEGRVTIAMRRADGLVEIRVSDDGPGIPAQFHDRVFEIFQTLASRDRVESSGMGLAIVKKMIEVHGGRVWIESAPPERGTTVAFTWKEEPR